MKRVAERIVAAKKDGNDVVVVVSAMGDTTDELLDLAAQITGDPPGRELDMLLTAGERISMALLAIAISTHGYEARSFTGSQAGVITTGSHGRARIIDVTPGRLRSALDEGSIVIVAGFQGVSQDTKDITTLGRGGSDTTAVAVATALAPRRRRHAPRSVLLVTCRPPIDTLHPRTPLLHPHPPPPPRPRAAPHHRRGGDAGSRRVRGHGPCPPRGRLRPPLRHPRAR